MDQLPCGTIVYRAMLRKQWIDQTTKTVLPAAFIRRPAPDDADGLSVDIVSPESCVSIFNKCHGVASLHVGRVREIAAGFDVIVDDSPHANIKGVPWQSEDVALAERYAGILAKQARLIEPPPKAPPQSS